MSSDGEGDDDEDVFDVTSEAAEGELEEDEESEEDYEESDYFHDDDDSYDEESYEESEDEMDEIETVNVCIQDIDDLFLLLKPYIKRKAIKAAENKPFSEELETLEQAENGPNELSFKCYNTVSNSFDHAMIFLLILFLGMSTFFQSPH